MLKLDQKRQKIQKNTRYIPKFILYPNYEIYECNFWHVFEFYIWVNDILYELDLLTNKCQKWV